MNEVEEINTTLSPRGLLGAFKVALIGCVVVAAFFFTVVKISQRFHLDEEAAFSVAFGILFLLLTLLRPNWFWYHPKALLARRFLTTPGTVLLYVGVAGYFIIGGVRRQKAVTQARLECIKDYAAAANSHERIRVLYQHGATNLPTTDDSDPKRISCERLLQ